MNSTSDLMKRMNVDPSFLEKVLMEEIDTAKHLCKVYAEKNKPELLKQEQLKYRQLRHIFDKAKFYQSQQS